MSAIAEGTIVVAVSGRRAGRQLTVTKVLPHGRIQAKDEKGKERNYSLRHVEPLGGGAK